VAIKEARKKSLLGRRSRFINTEAKACGDTEGSSGVSSQAIEQNVLTLLNAEVTAYQ
jgi:hypothetical protein